MLKEGPRINSLRLRPVGICRISYLTRITDEAIPALYREKHVTSTGRVANRFGFWFRFSMGFALPTEFKNRLYIPIM